MNEMTGDKKKNIINILKGSGIALAMTTILILILSIVLSYTKLSERIIPIATIIITGISILFGAIISTRNIKKSGLINGGAIGLIYIMILYIISSIFGSGFALNFISVIMILAGIIAGAIGGIIGVNFG